MTQRDIIDWYHSGVVSVERFLLWPLYLLSVCLGALTAGWSWSPPQERTREVPYVPDTYCCTGNLLRQHCYDTNRGSGGQCHSQGISFLYVSGVLCSHFYGAVFVQNWATHELAWQIKSAWFEVRTVSTPCLVTRLPALYTGQLQVFALFALVSCFPALCDGYMFSRALRWLHLSFPAHCILLHVFPRFALATCLLNLHITSRALAWHHLPV